MPYLIQQEVFIDQMGHPVQMHYYRTNLLSGTEATAADYWNFTTPQFEWEYEEIPRVSGYNTRASDFDRVFVTY